MLDTGKIRTESPSQSSRGKIVRGTRPFCVLVWMKPGGWQPVAIQGLRGLTVRTVTPRSQSLAFHTVEPRLIEIYEDGTRQIYTNERWSAISCFTSNIPGRADKGCSPLPFNAPNLIILIANPKNKFKDVSVLFYDWKYTKLSNFLIFLLIFTPILDILGFVC